MICIEYMCFPIDILSRLLQTSTLIITIHMAMEQYLYRALTSDQVLQLFQWPAGLECDILGFIVIPEVDY